jgi:hypothetical protein
VAIFTTNVDAENQTLINQKCVCGALNCQFLVGAVQANTFGEAAGNVSYHSFKVHQIYSIMAKKMN